MSDNPFASPEDLSAAVPESLGSSTVATAPAAAPAPDAVAPLESGVTEVALTAVPVAEPSQPRGRVGAGAVAAIAGGALILGALGGFGAAFAYDQVSNSDSNAPVTAALPASDTKDSSQQLEAGSVAQVSAAVLPSVVSIEASSGEGRTSTGSGFIVREDGYIVTNNHVVDGADGSIKVLFGDGTIVDAKVVGSTSDYDLAVLKVDKKGLTPAHPRRLRQHGRRRSCHRDRFTSGPRLHGDNRHHLRAPPSGDHR